MLALFGKTDLDDVQKTLETWEEEGGGKKGLNKSFEKQNCIIY